MFYDERLAQRIRDYLEGMPLMIEKKMFGGIGFLLRGNMACGVNGERMIVRIDPQAYETAMAKPHVRVFDMTGRPMKGWITVEPEGTAAETDLVDWIEQGLAYARSLSPK